MSKSALIIDTPKTCCDCMFCFDLGEVGSYCVVKDNEKDPSMRKELNPVDEFWEKRPIWCPLKKSSQKKKI